MLIKIKSLEQTSLSFFECLYQRFIRFEKKRLIKFFLLILTVSLFFSFITNKFKFDDNYFIAPSFVAAIAYAVIFFLDLIFQVFKYRNKELLIQDRQIFLVSDQKNEVFEVVSYEQDQLWIKFNSLRFKIVFLCDSHSNMQEIINWLNIMECPKI
jgi:hypothetical protein